jgi:hypothetical protein
MADAKNGVPTREVLWAMPSSSGEEGWRARRPAPTRRWGRVVADGKNAVPTRWWVEGLKAERCLRFFPRLQRILARKLDFPSVIVKDDNLTSRASFEEFKEIRQMTAQFR